MNLDGINEKWKSIQKGIIESYNDKITLYTAPTISGTSSNYSTFYDEPLDYNAPQTVSGVSADTDYSTKILYGQVILNLEGWQYGKDEEARGIPVGNIQPGDVLFRGMADKVYLNEDNPAGGNYFDGTDYIVVDKTKLKYRFLGIYPCGLMDINSCYVLLRQADKPQKTYST